MKNIVANVAGLEIGRGLPVVIQTMCNCNTNDIGAAVAQCNAMRDAGAQMIRLTTQGLREVESLKEVKRILREQGNNTPLVADVHFSSEVAIAVAQVADKVRINPGNFATEHEKAQRDFKRFIEVCREHNTAVRIGINHGSLGKRITELYGNTAQGMKEAMVEWVQMCIQEDFYNVVLSLKASNTVVMVEAYRLLNQWMEEQGVIFPLHLGVTEAGNGDMGRIKSAAALATLLQDGIGDTIRVSLTEPPVNELPVAASIAEYFRSPEGPRSGTFTYNTPTREEFIIRASCEIGPLLLDRKIDDFEVDCTCAGEKLSEEEINDFKDNLMQATRRRFTKCEYVACPGCGRTLYNLEETFNEVKRRTSHLSGYCIAVMGCIVNGPGEMADADYGYVGEGKGKVSIYRGKEAVMRSVPQEEAIDALLELIENDKKQK
jgi:(E)-4-hydroxy-3-methylbut-2-enyl-diphosphate synthase